MLLGIAHRLKMMSHPFSLFHLLYPFALFTLACLAQSKAREQALVAPVITGVKVQAESLPARLADVADRGAALYYLAAQNQSLGQTPSVLRLLEECVALHEGFDPAGSPGMGRLKGNPIFDALVTKVHNDFPAIDGSRLAYETSETGLVPEGLAWDPANDAFYLSSMNLRKIVKISAAGVISDFVASSRYDLLPVLGVRPDPFSGTVWAASWEEDSARSELLHFDSSGQLLARYKPEPQGEHGFNDLVVRRGGKVLLTDSLRNQVLSFDTRSHIFSVLKTYRQLSAPNGLALTRDERMLYVADDFGITIIDLTTGVSLDVNPGPHNTLAGIDGLYWNKGTLVAIQNAIGSPRIAAFRLSKDGTRVIQTTVLENRPSFPFLSTTGAIRGW